MAWLSHFYFWFTGARNPSGAAYGQWSGWLGANWPVLGVAALFYWHHSCHNGACLRFGKHTTAQGYRLCKKHVGMPLADLKLHPVHEDHQ
jgi:hypothetical protein